MGKTNLYNCSNPTCGGWYAASALFVVGANWYCVKCYHAITDKMSVAIATIKLENERKVN